MEEPPPPRPQSPALAPEQPPPPSLTEPPDADSGSATPKQERRFHRRGVLGLVLGVLGIAAIAVLIVLDVGLQSKVNSLDRQMKTTKAGLASASAISSALAASDTADQLQIAALQSLVPTQPNFSVVSSSWQKGCSADTCYPAASVINLGETGQAVAVFGVYQGSPATSTELATCSASIPSTAPNGANDVSCPASSAALIQYFESNPTGQVSLKVVIQNP